jgi:hypothetical protein
MIRSLTQKQKTDLIEKLADLEHKQWIKWSKSLVQKKQVPIERELRWKKLWIPYSALSEELKEQDRVWARKVIKILKELNLEVVSK